MTNNEEFEKILENIDENGPEPQEEPQRQYYFMKKARAILKQKAEELGRPLTACTVKADRYSGEDRLCNDRRRTCRFCDLQYLYGP